MQGQSRKVIFCLLLTLFFAGACASLEQVFDAPDVSLREVEATDLGFSSQTFVLNFEVSNPNPFPLPIDSIAYGVELDGYRFATGRVPHAFTVPAKSDGSVAINVKLDLLRTAPQLLHIVRDSVDRDVPYELRGEFLIDLPGARPVVFREAGAIRLTTDGLRARLP